MKNDPLFKIKRIAFRKACLPPKPEPVLLPDFVEFAKVNLCVLTKTLYKDPIWDEYTEADILMEYYMHLFLKDQKSKEDFEIELNGGKLSQDDWLAWADAQIEAENKKRNEELLKNSEDDLSFNPSLDVL
jgi:hypothetical protein